MSSDRTKKRSLEGDDIMIPPKKQKTTDREYHNSPYPFDLDYLSGTEQPIAVRRHAIGLLQTEAEYWRTKAAFVHKKAAEATGRLALEGTKWKSKALEAQRTAEIWHAKCICSEKEAKALKAQVDAQSLQLAFLYQRCQQLEAGLRRPEIEYAQPKLSVSPRPAGLAVAQAPLSGGVAPSSSSTGQSEVIDLTETDKEPTGRSTTTTSGPSGSRASEQERSQFLEGLCSKPYSWLGSRNHMKNGFAPSSEWDRVREAQSHWQASRKSAASAVAPPVTEENETFDEFLDELEAELQADASAPEPAPEEAKETSGFEDFAAELEAELFGSK